MPTNSKEYMKKYAKDHSDYFAEKQRERRKVNKEKNDINKAIEKINKLIEQNKINIENNKIILL
jgi:hypothetical protein